MTPEPRVVMVDGVPMSGLVASVDSPRAVIVALHGGGTSSIYFDCPGHPQLSFLRAAAERGFTAVALDRPGYGASALYADEMVDTDRRVALACGTVDALVDVGVRGAGLFFLGHSAGCELAVRMSLAGADVPPVGLSLAGTGLRYCTQAQMVIRTAMKTFERPGLRELLWQPAELYPDGMPSAALAAPGARYEKDVTAHWPGRDFPDLAARITAPVQFAYADHEAVWDSTPEAIADIVALFTAAPRVVPEPVNDSGHNISVGVAAPDYHRKVFSFIEECIAGEFEDREAEVG